MNKTREEIQELREDIRRAKAEFFNIQQTLPINNTDITNLSENTRVQEELCTKAISNSQIVLIESVSKLAKAVSKLADHVEKMDARLSDLEVAAEAGDAVSGASQGPTGSPRENGREGQRSNERPAQPEDIISLLSEFPNNRAAKSQEPGFLGNKPKGRLQETRLYDLDPRE